VPRHVVRRSSLHLRGVRKLDLTAIPPVGANPPPAVSFPHEQYLDHRFSFVAWLLRPKPRLVTTRTVSRAAAVTSVPHLPSQTSDFHLPVFSFSRITTTEDWVVSNEISGIAVSVHRNHHEHQHTWRRRNGQTALHVRTK
jgi:hypothetical protein